jgi:hypothetical protein
MSDGAVTHSRHTADGSAVVGRCALVLTNTSSISVALISRGTQVKIVAGIDSELAVDTTWVDGSVDQVITVFTWLDDTISTNANITR